nr:MAG TPA: hypothetical protein [Caudoviricetes sp.]
MLSILKKIHSFQSNLTKIHYILFEQIIQFE